MFQPWSWAAKGNNNIFVELTAVGINRTDFQWKQCAEGNWIKVNCSEALEWTKGGFDRKVRCWVDWQNTYWLLFTAIFKQTFYCKEKTNMWHLEEIFVIVAGLLCFSWSYFVTNRTLTQRRSHETLITKLLHLLWGNYKSYFKQHGVNLWLCTQQFAHIQYKV